MKIPEFKSLAEAHDFVAALAKDNTAQTKALAIAQKSIEDKTAAVSAIEADLAIERAAIKQLQGDLTTARQSLQSVSAEAEKLKATAKSAESKAAEICASVGVTPVRVTPQGEPKSNSDLVAQLKSFKSPAQQIAFFRKNKADLIASANRA